LQIGKILIIIKLLIVNKNKFNLIIGGMPGSGSSFFFKNLSKYFDNRFFETGFFCENKIYQSNYKTVLFEKYSKSCITNIDMKQNFIEKTPENIFFANDILNSLNKNIFFVCTIRNPIDSINSLLLRGNNLFQSFFICVSSLIFAKSIRSERYKLFSYEEFTKKFFFEKLIKDFKLKESKAPINFNKTFNLNSWNYNIDKKYNEILPNSNPKINFYKNNLFIKWKNSYYDFRGEKVELKDEIEIIRLEENNINKFLFERNLCLVGKI
jgi:hypothetical protein